MTKQNQGQVAFLTDGDGQPAYAVPVSVLEAHRATPEQRAEMEAPLYVLTAEALEPYRLSDDQQEALEARAGGAAAGDDAEGYTYSPHDPHNQGFGMGGLIWTSFTYMDGSRGPRWIQARYSQTPKSHDGAGYHPPLR